MQRLILVLLLSISAPALATQNSVPLKDWLRFPAFTSVIISPSGKYLAVASALKNDFYRYQLAIIPTRSVIQGKPKVVAHYSLRDYQIFSDIFWINDDRIAAATAFKRGGFNRPFLTGDLFAIDVDGGNQRALMGSSTSQYFQGLLSRLPQNKRAILVDAQGAAVWLDTYTGASHTVTRNPTNGGMLADHNGDVRIAWGTNNLTGWPKLYYRAAGKMKWINESKLIDTHSMAASALMTGGPVMFGPKNKGVYFETWSDDPAKTLGLYFYNFQTGKKELLYKNPKVDVGGLIESFNHKSIVGLYTELGKPEASALDPHAKKIQLLAGLMQVFPKEQVDITSASKDGEKDIVYTWSDTQPGMYYLYSSKPSPHVTPLFHQVPWLKPEDLSPMKSITFKSRDGLTIHGYLTIPRGTAPKNLPMVLYIHGGPHGVRTDWGFDPTDFDSIAEQILANHGYAVLSLNYRGSGGYGLKFMEAGFRHWGSTMQDDLADGVHWAIKRGIANPHRVCVFGASYGGYAALMNSELFPDLYRCAIGYDGVYDLGLEESRASDTGRQASGRLYLKTVLGTNPKQLKAFSPAFNADKLKIPVFLLHGGRDLRAPVKGYDEMVDAIKKHGTPLKTLYESNEGHGFYKPAHREKAWQDILGFLGKYIGPDAKNVAANSH